MRAVRHRHQKLNLRQRGKYSGYSGSRLAFVAMMQPPRPGPAPLLALLPAVESIAARASPSLMRGAFWIGDSNPNTNEGYDVASFRCCSTPIWCRRARFSNAREVRERKIENHEPFLALPSSQQGTILSAKDTLNGRTDTDRSSYRRTLWEVG